MSEPAATLDAAPSSLGMLPSSQAETPDEKPIEVAPARVEMIDVVRGWAILLVVVGHSIQWTIAGFDANPVFRLIYSFHMPLFFFISGVVGERGIHRGLPQLLRSKALGLLLPFFSWWLLESVVRWALGGRGLVSALLALYGSPDEGLWFLWVLFFITMVAAVALRLAPSGKQWVALLAASAALWAIRLPVLGFGLASWYFPFFAAGLMSSPHFMRQASGGSDGLPLAAIAAGGWSALALGWHRVGLTRTAEWWSSVGLPLSRVVDLVSRYATAAAGIAASVIAFAWLATASSARIPLRYLGRNTLEVYVSHALVLGLFSGASALWAPVAATCALAGSLATASLLKRVPVLRVALYGGRS